MNELTQIFKLFILCFKLSVINIIHISLLFVLLIVARSQNIYQNDGKKQTAQEKLVTWKSDSKQNSCDF